jgi:sugar phosphate isomerase/epimerase
LEVVRRTAGSRLGLLFDTANSLVLGDDPLALLRQVSDRIRAGHVSNMHRAGMVA